MSDLNFSINDQKINGDHHVQQGDSRRVIFTNHGSVPVTVQVVGAPGSRPGGKARPEGRDPGAASLFIDGSVTFTVRQGEPTVKTIGATPDRGTYHLSTPNGGPGTIMIDGLDFKVDDEGKVSGQFTVTQGAASHLSYTNQSSKPQQITVRVEGMPEGGRTAPVAASLFTREQRAMTTINLEGKEERKLGGQLGPSPDLGTYRLSNGPPGDQGTIKVESIDFTIVEKNGIVEVDSKGFNVSQGAELTVTFDNKTGKAVTVYIFPANGQASSFPLFQTGGNSPVRLAEGGQMDAGRPIPRGIEMLTVGAVGTPMAKVSAVLSASGSGDNFTVSTLPPPCSSGGWINHRPGVQ